MFGNFLNFLISYYKKINFIPSTSSNICSKLFLNLEGIETVFNLSFIAKAFCPIDWTLLGITTFSRFLQSQNAYSLTSKTVLGIEIDLHALPQKAYSPITSKPFEKTIFFKL